MVDTPPPADSHEITRLLRECGAGDERAADQLVPLLYEQLREIARRHLRKEAPGHTVNTTALVHEAYLGLVDQESSTWKDRAHFLATSSRVMRHILIDHARRRGAGKRGGDRVRVPLREDAAAIQDGGLDLLALNEALESLEEKDPTMARVVEHRFFGGMTMEETGEVLGVSPRTVKRVWTRARMHLYRALGEGDGGSGQVAP